MKKFMTEQDRNNLKWAMKYTLLEQCNKSNKCPKDQKKFIKSLIKGFEPTLQTTTSQQLIWEKYVIYAPDEVGNQIQVFNYYGDIVLSDGTLRFICLATLLHTRMQFPRLEL